MGKLHQYLQENEGTLIIVLDGNDKIGILAMSSEHEYFVVMPNKTVYNFKDKKMAHRAFAINCVGR